MYLLSFFVTIQKFGKYKLLFRLGKMPQKTDSYATDPEGVEINLPCLETEKATELLESLLNEPDK